MFTPQMTDEELQDAAYRDFLEIRMKVHIAYEQFVQSLRLGEKSRRLIHSVIVEKKVLTKSKNNWHVVFVNTGYTLQGEFMASCLIYIPLYREGAVDYLFMNITEDFVLEKLTAHFLMRYKERYLECKGINLKGMHPAVYYMINNQDKTLTYYMPDNWTEQEMVEKAFMISRQGLSLAKYCTKMRIMITFLDQENLSRYKALVYEEESLWKEVECLEDPKLSDEFKLEMLKRLASDPEKTKAIMRRYLQRIKGKKLVEEEMNACLDEFDRLIDSASSVRSRLKKVEKLGETIQVPSMEYYFRQIKKMK